MGYSDAAKNLMLDQLADAISFASLHDADPGTNGANELSGGTPAYARKAIAFGTASGGSVDDSTNGAAFDVPAGGTVAYVGVWSGSTGGTFYGAGSLDSAEVFASQGTFTLDDLDLDLNS